MEKQFEILRSNRLTILKVIEDLNIDQLNKIPEGFKNNICWNIGHLLVTQQLLCYKFSGQKLAVNQEMINNFQKGTSPKEFITPEVFEKIKSQFISLINQFQNDLNSPIFSKYQAYTTSTKVVLTNINEAIEFNNYHEGIHLGYILALKKLV